MNIRDFGPLAGMALLLVFAILAAVAIDRFDLQPHVRALVAWVESLGPWAPVAFVAIDALFVIALLPGVLLTLSAGFLFGVVRGTAYVVIWTTIGACIAYMLARGLIGARVRAAVANHPKLAWLSNASTGTGWQFVLLTRIIPFFPFKLSNYVFGASPIRFDSFLYGTVVGIVPYSFTNVYIGSLAANLSEHTAGVGPQTTLQWFVYLLGLLATIAAITYLSLRVRRAFRSEFDRVKRDQ